MNSKQLSVLLGVVVVALLGVVGYMTLKNNNAQDQKSTTPTPNQTSVKAQITSLSIEPSHKEGGWLMYSDGAKVIVKGSDLQTIEIRYLPTGSGMTQEYPQGKLLGTPTSLSSIQGTWVMPMPKNIMATNIWVQGKDANGNLIKGPDLGNVGYDESSTTTIPGTENWKMYSSSQYGFEIKYPKDFPIHTGLSGQGNKIFTLAINDVPPPGDVGGPPRYLFISAEPKRALSGCGEEGKASGKIVIDGVSVTKCILPGSYFGEGEGLVVEVERGNYTYSFYADYYDRNKAEIDKIISTFKFIK